MFRILRQKKKTFPSVYTLVFEDSGLRRQKNVQEIGLPISKRGAHCYVKYYSY